MLFYGNLRLEFLLLNNRMRKNRYKWGSYLTTYSSKPEFYRSQQNSFDVMLMEVDLDSLHSVLLVILVYDFMFPIFFLERHQFHLHVTKSKKEMVECLITFLYLVSI